MFDVKSMFLIEFKKNFGLPTSLKLPLLTQRYVTLYSKIPGVNYALAIQMAINFKNPKDLFTAAYVTLLKKLKLDEKRARKIHTFFRSKFQSDMTKH